MEQITSSEFDGIDEEELAREIRSYVWRWMPLGFVIFLLCFAPMFIFFGDTDPAFPYIYFGSFGLASLASVPAADTLSKAVMAKIMEAPNEPLQASLSDAWHSETLVTVLALVALLTWPMIFLFLGTLFLLIGFEDETGSALHFMTAGGFAIASGTLIFFYRRGCNLLVALLLVAANISLTEAMELSKKNPKMFTLHAGRPMARAALQAKEILDGR